MQILCFYHANCVSAVCAVTQGDNYATINVDPLAFPKEDGDINTMLIDYDLKVNLDDFGTMGAGIGNEFGHAYDSETNIWTVWYWADSSDNEFPYGEYDVHIIQQDEAGIHYFFSDTLILNSSISIFNVAFASVTVFFALM